MMATITFERCPGCTSRIRALDGVILYPHDAEDCRLSNAYSHAPNDDERDRVAAAMQARTDVKNNQTCRQWAGLGDHSTETLK